MTGIAPYRVVITLVVLSLIFGCSKQLNKRITLWRNDRIPYGTYYAFHNLQYIFTDALIKTSNESPVSFYGNDETSSAYIIIGNSVRPDEKELKAILNHAISGNHVFISALHIGENLLDSFKLSATSIGNLFYKPDSLTVSLLDLSDYDSIPFTYPGFALDNYFTKFDSSVTNILGKDAKGNANFVKFTYQGGGAILIHLSPAAFTNFFLLHKNNKRYYDIVLSSIPDTVDLVRWDDYYRHHMDGNNRAERSAFSKLSTFLQNDVLRWAFWLAIVLFGIIYLFESKRKQRVVPSIRKLNNSSLDFVKTIGRLYYQRKDNKNLAVKMSTHFLGHVRTRYNMHTSHLNEDFAISLAYKSGYSIQLVKDIVYQIRTFEDAYQVTDDELLAFNDKIDNFINKP